MENEIEELIKKLKTQFDYLCSIKIKGMAKEDVRQELILYVLETIKENPKYLENKYKLGWWFIRLKWRVLNKMTKENREPINKSTRLSKFNI